MRRGWALAMLLSVVLGGCTTARPLRSTGWLDRFRRLNGPTGPDVVQMDIALLERPVGDSYINRDLWTTADEQVIALERKAQLDDNGFRVGQTIDLCFVPELNTWNGVTKVQLNLKDARAR